MYIKCLTMSPLDSTAMQELSLSLSLNKIPYSLILVLFDDERAPQVCSDVIVRSYRTCARANLLPGAAGYSNYIFVRNTVFKLYGKTTRWLPRKAKSNKRTKNLYFYKSPSNIKHITHSTLYTQTYTRL
jgi:hypothetical protein